LNSLGIATFNHLYGLQLGAEAEVYNMGGPLVVRATCKAGAYDNVAEQLRAVDLGRGNMAVNTSGALFYYGGGLGLEYRY